MSVLKRFPDEKRKMKVAVLILLVITAVIVWKFIIPVEGPASTVAKFDKEFVNPVTQKDERGEIVESTLSESFDLSRIKAINPISPSSPQDLVAQYPPEASSTGALFMAQNLPPKYSVDKYSVKFKSTDQKNETIVITSQVFIPKAADVKNLPVYVFGSGTTGLGDNCAPSKEQPKVANWANYIAHMLAFSAQGYIVVFPDYEGFNDSNRIHHYFNSELESRVLLDGARAIYKFSEKEALATKPQDAVFIAGFSQGGHAALSAKDFAVKYAPKLPIKGIIAYAPATDVTALLKEAPALSPYLFYAYSDFYGKDIIDPQKVLQPKWLETLEKDVTSICIDKIYQYYGYDPKQIYTTEFYEALFNNNLASSYPKFKEALDKNTTGFEKSQIPVIIYQGATDNIVTAKTVREVTKRLCDSGNNVTYKEYPNMDHFKIRQISYRETLSWMQNILKGGQQELNCNTL